MKLKFHITRGDSEKPAIVLIHGLGMDRNIWVDPSESHILGGLLPLRVMVGRKRDKPVQRMESVFHDLVVRGYSIVTWSQGRPAGPIDLVIPELKEAVKLAGASSLKGVVLIGHSRGGLIARRYLSSLPNDSVRMLITVATPHKGSSMARLAGCLSPLASGISRFVPPSEKECFALSLKRVCEFLSSNALRELLPDSPFFQALKDERREDISYAALGGTNPALFTLCGIAFPSLLEKIVPAGIYPEEMRSGRGDGLVSLESSKFPWESEHRAFHCNHAEALLRQEVRSAVVDLIEQLR
jgi:pimeloyl-ACP methyl ester carboxylesterase